MRISPGSWVLLLLVCATPAEGVAQQGTLTRAKAMELLARLPSFTEPEPIDLKLRYLPCRLTAAAAREEVNRAALQSGVIITIGPDPDPRRRQHNECQGAVAAEFRAQASLFQECFGQGAILPFQWVRLFAKRRVLEVTGIQGGTVSAGGASVEFRWQRTSNSVFERLAQAWPELLGVQSGTASFVLYDDGWRFSDNDPLGEQRFRYYDHGGNQGMTDVKCGPAGPALFATATQSATTPQGAPPTPAGGASTPFNPTGWYSAIGSQPEGLEDLQPLWVNTDLGGLDNPARPGQIVIHINLGPTPPPTHGQRFTDGWIIDTVMVGTRVVGVAVSAVKGVQLRFEGTFVPSMIDSTSVPVGNGAALIALIGLKRGDGPITTQKVEFSFGLHPTDLDAANNTVARPATCAALGPEVYRLALEGKTYSARRRSAAAAATDLVFLSQEGVLVTDTMAARAFSEAVWVYENVVKDPYSQRGLKGQQRTRILLSTQSDLKRYEIVQDVLARAMVQVVAAAATGGTLSGSVMGLPRRLFNSQLANPYGLLAVAARLGVEEAQSAYSRIASLTSGRWMSPTSLYVADAASVLDLHFKASVLELSYGTLLSALLPKTGHALLKEAVNASTDELLSVLAPGTDLVPWQEVYDMNSWLVDLSEGITGLRAYHESYNASLRTVAQARAAIARQAAAAASGCR